SPSAASSDDRLRPLLIGRDDEVREALEKLEGEPRAVQHEPLEPLFLDDEQLDVLRGNGTRRTSGPAAKEGHLAQGLALAVPVHDLLDTVEGPANLDRARMDAVRLVARVVALLEDVVARLEPAPLDVTEREVLVELEPDRRQRRLRLHRQGGVWLCAHAAFAATGRRALVQLPRPPLRMRTFLKPRWRRSCTTRALCCSSGLVQ